MKLAWSDSLDAMDWEELSSLNKIAPLGNKKPSDLKTVFANSMFRLFVYDGGRLIGAGRALADGIDCAYLAAPGKDEFYLKLGFRRMQTAMAIFEDEAGALKSGVVA